MSGFYDLVNSLVSSKIQKKIDLAVGKSLFANVKHVRYQKPTGTGGDDFKCVAKFGGDTLQNMLKGFSEVTDFKTEFLSDYIDVCVEGITEAIINKLDLSIANRLVQSAKQLDINKPYDTTYIASYV